MQWHFDKDETVYERDGTVISPAIGSVYYPVPNTVQGGYLEIQDESKEIERIAPVFNRMVIFQSDHLHRVSPCMQARALFLSLTSGRKKYRRHIKMTIKVQMQSKNHQMIA